MGLWKSYKVVIVMGTGLGLIHWGWYRIQSDPVFNPDARVPSIIQFFSGKDKDAKGK